MEKVNYSGYVKTPEISEEEIYLEESTTPLEEDSEELVWEKKHLCKRLIERDGSKSKDCY